MCKTRFDSRELFSMVVNKIILHNMIRARETPPPHGKCHFKIPFFGRLPLGRPKFGHCLPLFCFHDCSLFRSKPVSTSWCFGARAGALWNFEQSKTKWIRHLEHCLWYGSSGRPKQVHLKLQQWLGPLKIAVKVKAPARALRIFDHFLRHFVFYAIDLMTYKQPK